MKDRDSFRSKANFRNIGTWCIRQGLQVKLQFSVTCFLRDCRKFPDFEEGSSIQRGNYTGKAQQLDSWSDPKLKLLVFINSQMIWDRESMEDSPFRIPGQFLNPSSATRLLWRGQLFEQLALDSEALSSAM